eukprot:CAMPEP_0113559746 /NCGR_PEP_ID=MMETSP0015_2-20120614/19062_1 /TAXON_ID=2838 /ORGANISM="Odontella" /LENGTH=427 /DNA_ID=CAMNT_0000461405 /DNA_START=283 /DNA_END=1566 /DNA_ORIENTATION=- /assembly_acc=CAM_ASM_000160
MSDPDDILSGRAREVLDQMSRSAVPNRGNPFASTVQRLGKADLYEESELMNVLSIHNECAELGISDLKSIKQSPAGEGPELSLHELVMASIGDEGVLLANDTSVLTSAGAFTARAQPLQYQIDSAMRKRIKGIRAIASDVDGTLLSSRQTIHPRTRMALKRALQYSEGGSTKEEKIGIECFFPATGKSRRGALDSLGIEIGSMIAEGNVPGVYLQGLYCVDGGGEVVFEKKLTVDAIAAAEELVKETGISVVAYDGDDLFTTDTTDIVVHLHEHYGEPLPRLIVSASDMAMNLSEHEPSMHKLLLMDNDVEKLRTVVRPQLEVLAAEFDATVTQALPTMLELLPAGCSKAMGVTKLCSALGLNMGEELLALGDAENDAEMLNSAAVGVAMGNGCPIAKEAADFIMNETADDGAAGIAMEIFAFRDFE